MSLSDFAKKATVAIGLAVPTLTSSFEEAKAQDVNRIIEGMARGAIAGALNQGGYGSRSYRIREPGKQYADEPDRCNVPYYRPNGNVGGTINVCTERGRRQMQEMQGGSRGHSEPQTVCRINGKNVVVLGTRCP